LKAPNGAREYLYGRMLRLILGSQSDSTPWIFRVFVHSKVVILSTRPLYFRCVWMSSFFLYKFYGSVCTHYGRGTSNYPVTIFLLSQHEPEDCRYSFREPIPVHPPGLHVHPPLLTRTPPRGNLKFPLRITQLHTKFSRQFKGLHMILSNFSMTFLTALNSVNLV